jgi:hypothetical protein
MEGEENNNISNEFYERYFASTSYGQHLFFVEIYECGMPEYLLNTSLKIDIYKYSKFTKLIKIIANKNTSGTVRKMFVEILLKNIKEVIPDISNYYFRSIELDKFGKYSDAWSKTYEALISNYQLRPYEPFSIFRNDTIFGEINKVFTEEKINRKTSVEINKNLFEEHLISDELKFAYTEVYTNNAKYYIQEGFRNDEVFEFCCMTSNCNELLLFFLIQEK